MVYEQRISVFSACKIVQPANFNAIQLLRSNILQVVKTLDLPLLALVLPRAKIATSASCHSTASICNGLALVPFFKVLGQLGGCDLLASDRAGCCGLALAPRL